MAEDDLRPASEESDEEPQIRVPSHDPLPPPPEIHYSRPAPGYRPGAQTPRTEYGYEPSNVPGPVRYTNGLAGGLSLVSSILAGYWLGSQIDARWVHTQTPWATMVMVLAGTFVGFYSMFRMLNRSDRSKK